MLDRYFRLSPQCGSVQSLQGIGRYVKKKRLDPLETYVPSVLLAKRQLQAAGDVMGAHTIGRCFTLRLPFVHRFLYVAALLALGTMCNVVAILGAKELSTLHCSCLNSRAKPKAPCPDK